MAFLWNHQMFLQVFSKKVCFCCILGCFAEKKLPRMSQILTDGACLEFCEFCVLWEYSSPTDCTDQHRWLVALVVAWVRQDAIPSYICVNPCYLWETLLYKKVLWILWILWGKITARRFCEFCEFCGRKSQQEGCVGIARMPYPPKVSPFRWARWRRRRCPPYDRWSQVSL